jgi:DSF synthase
MSKSLVRTDTSLPIEIGRTEPGKTSAAITQSRLFDLGQLDCRWDEELRTLWTFMTPLDRPNYSPAMLRDLATLQAEVTRLGTVGEAGMQYLVLGSRFPHVFNYGGDLELFRHHITTGNSAGLAAYGKSCVGVLHTNLNAMNVPIITIGLVQGEALGGGFESLLSFNIVIAERGSRFGLPEAMFGLFPGMGAHSILTRRVGTARADEMIRTARLYTAEELFDIGLVHVLAEPGEGEQAVTDYIRRNRRSHAGQHGAYRAQRLVENITLQELEGIVDIWAEAALGLTSTQLRMMERLANAQTRLSAIAAAS